MHEVDFGSTDELAISSELGFGQDESRESANSLSEEVSRMLIAMMKKLRN